MVRALVLAAGLALVAVLGCGGGLWDCDDMERVVKRISGENWYATGGSPIERVEAIVELSRTEERVECGGLAWLENGDNRMISFHQYYNEGGDLMTGFEVLW